jgi:hypothetical protein
MKSSSRKLISFACLTLSATLATAQQPQPNFYRISFVKTKPDKVADFQAFFKETVIPIQKVLIQAGSVT